MNAQIVSDSRYSTAHFVTPSPFGYIHVGADVNAPSRPGPILRRGPEKFRLENRLKGLARQLEQADNVEKATLNLPSTWTGGANQFQTWQSFTTLSSPFVLSPFSL